MSNVKLSPPWDTICDEIREFFKYDEDVTVNPVKQDDNGDYVVVVGVNGETKYEALNKLLKKEYNMGNVTLKVEVVPVDVVDDGTITYKTFKEAFYGNPRLVDAFRTGFGPTQISTDYAIFKKEIIQFYNDDISDYFNNANMLPTTVAEDIFVENDVNYSISEE